MSQSPSSVRWHYDAMMHHLQHKRHIDDLGEGEGEGVDDFDRLSEAWNIPDATEMKRRLNVRKEILVETLQHRRIHRHGGIVCGRNIAHVLAHRETYGARALKHNRNYQLPLPLPLPLPKQAPDTQADQEKSAGTPGALSAPRTPTISNSSPQASSSRPAPDIAGRTKSQRIPFAGSLSNEIRLFAEYCSVTRYHSAFFRHLGGDDELDQNGQRPSSSNSVSTISVAFSPDSLTMASTHGDHTVKITSSASGHLLQTLEGHPRTPWTVKYLPHDAAIIASGCLGHQVRIWNWETAVCLHMIRLEFAIISLSFHPTGQVLAIANGTRLHFWALDEKLRLFKCKGSRDQDTDEDGSNNNNSNSNSTLESTPTATTATTDANQATGSVEAQTTEQQRQNQRRGLLTEVEQRHMLRCVHFAPQGNTVIVGGVNPTAETPRPRRGGISGGGMSFYLRLWDFDLEAALRPGETNMGIRRRAISNPRTFLPRALLYNDGGFDVSPDGKTLCACAEYWLPDGVENALDLHPQEDDDESDSEDVDPAKANTNTSSGRATNNATDASDARKTPTPLDGEHTLDTRPGLSVSPPRLRQPTPMHPPGLIVGRHNPLTPQTPPTSGIRPHFTLSPPSPPGRRFAGGLGRPPATSGDTRVPGTDSQSMRDGAGTGSSSSGIPPPPPPPPGINNRPPNPFSMPNREGGLPQHGRYVPHVVTISLDTSPVQNDLVPGRNPNGRIGIPSGAPNGMPRNARPRLGQLLEACPLYGTKASAVTCVKFSPSTNFCLIGYGVREPVVEHNGNQYHPVTALYRIRGGMTHVSTMLSGDDDVNISRFHPDPGYGFVYGTKQGRVRVLSPRPWNYYNC